MPLYKFLHNLLNVQVGVANKFGLQKNEYVYHPNVAIESFLDVAKQRLGYNVTAATSTHAIIEEMSVSHEGKCE
jgi:hypothetical protein